MKCVYFTFDDGRKNNYSVAIPILKKYHIKATFFITTGYIDESWHPSQGTWKSAGSPMSAEEIVEIDQENDFEVALHGDTHIMEESDFFKAKQKMDEWVGEHDKYGFSIPNSTFTNEEYSSFLHACKTSLLYVRAGGISGKKGILSKVKKAIRVYSRSKKFYVEFYKKCVFDIDRKPDLIPSIGIRKNDTVEQVEALISQAPENSNLVFMFHSIYPDNSNMFKDDWAWSKEKLEELCSYLSTTKCVETRMLKELK